MAQLARCPACYSEIELPTDAGGDDAWAECPACAESFAISQAKPRLVKQAKLVSAPVETEEKSEASAESTKSADATPTSIDMASSSLGIPTLESFLSGDATTEATTDTTSKAKSPTVSNFDTLDDLMKVALPEKAETTVEQGGSETQDDPASTPEEPSPTADRLRPTLSEMFASSSPDSSAAAESPVAEDPIFEDAAAESSLDEGMVDAASVEDSASYDAVEEVSDDESEEDPEPAEVGFKSLTASSLVDDEPSTAPSFDFSVGDDDMEDSKSLRAAMGFAGDDPLEVADEPHELAGLAGSDEEPAESSELQFAGSDSPRGVVSTKRRSPLWTAVRVMLGIATSGVVGLGAGYLVILWVFHFTGRTDEPLALAQYYPDAVKPSTFRDGESLPVPDTDALAVAEDDSDTDPTSEGEFTTSSVDGSEEENRVAPANFETDLSLDEGADGAPEPWESDALPAIPVVIDGAPSYTAADLQQLTSMASEQTATLLADGPVDRSKGGSYATIAKLADALTFGEGVSDASWKTNARRLFPDLFVNEQTRLQIAQIAGFWLTSDKRGHGGIFFSGAPDAGRQQGRVAEYQFTLPMGKQLTVLTPQALPDRIANAPSVAVIGSVIDDPASRIEGYTGSAEQAIWSYDLLPITE